MLSKAKNIYNDVVCADVTKRMPFEDNTFDYIVSSDLIGHIPTKGKEVMFSEMYRILKKEGMMIHVAETDSKNFIFKFAKKYPNFFKKYFIIEIGGHFGLELPSQLISRIRKIGFIPVYEKKIWGPIWPVEGYFGMFDNEYKTKSNFLRIIVGLSKMIGKNEYLKTAINCFLGPISNILELMMPLDNGQGMLLCYKKP